jgi:Mn-dependent DtxR family transcriptional regulator
MQPESLDAFEKVKMWKKDSQLRVYRCIERRGAATLEDVARDLGVPVHCISGRITELKQMGRIVKGGIAVTSAGNTCSVYAVNDKFGGVI